MACVWSGGSRVLEGSLAAVLFVEALRTQRLGVYLMVVAAGLAATLPARPPWGTTARRWAGGGLVVLAIVILAVPSVPAGTVSPSLPVQAFNYLSAHPGRIFTEYTWGDYSIARHRATFVDGRTDLFEGQVLTEFFAVTNLTTNPDPMLSAYHVVLCRVGTRHAAGGVPRPRPPLACRGPDVGGAGLRPSLSGRDLRHGQAYVASRPRRSPSSSAQVRTASDSRDGPERGGAARPDRRRARAAAPRPGAGSGAPR